MTKRTDTPEARYRRDPVFHHFVDAVHKLLMKAEMSPSEVCEGAMLAYIHYELHEGPQLMSKRDSDG